jgi:uncharacterized protein YyaL (SSP411 family)
MSDQGPTNELAQATSSYLRSARHQPVQWRAWGDPAFDEARREDKPILLDIGAVWCHWCHVMDRESYESPEVAEIINRDFVAVKVDRDERPDIDARYQAAVSALTGQGGWPLTVFLTPEGKPFYGGTYFPPDDSYGRPGLKRLLQAVAQNYKSRQAEILESAERITEALGKVDHLERNGAKAGRAVLEAILESIRNMFDPQHGGFGTQPKFPHPAAIDLLLDMYLETRAAWMLSAVTTTLEHMGRGGVYDQIGGGFHRYSVDARWIVPHFEKMSYDNAGLLVNYLRAYQVTGDEFFREIALGILGFIETVLSHPEGGFYSSQDADYSLDDDGDYFTWTLEELRAVLEPREAEVAAQYYHVEAQGEMHHNPAKNVLFIDQPFEAIGARLKLSVDEVQKMLASAKEKMARARARRPTPFVDPTIYSSWNGMMVSALLEAYKVLGLAGARDRALTTLDLLLREAYVAEKGMAHSLLRVTPTEGSSQSSNVDFRVSNFDLLDDQVFMAGALLDAYEIAGERSYFDRAQELMETTVRRFWDEENGGFYDTAKDASPRQGSLRVTRKSFQDAPTPARNSVAALVLDRLSHLAERPDYREKAEVILELLAPQAGNYGLFAATYGQALANHLRPPVQVVVLTDSAGGAARNLVKTAYETPRAGKRVLVFNSDTIKSRNLPSGLAATLPNLPVDNLPVALVCVGTSCLPPVRTPEALRKALEAQ